MEGLIALAIDKRVKGYGFKDYSIRMESVELNSTTPKHVLAQNEFWFLTDCDDTTDAFIIQADNTMISSSEFLFSTIPFGVVDFVGDVFITKPEHTATQKLLFARVIPKL